MHRSIFPESRSRTATGADLNRLRSWVSTRIGSAPPARFDDAQPWPLFLPPRRDELGNRSGSRNRRRFRAEPAAVRPASASRCWPRYVIPIATACEAASNASACSGRPRQSFGAEHSVRRCDLRCNRDLDVVLDPEPDRRPHRDAASSETGGPVAFRRARAVARNPDCSLAASVNAVLEADRRGLSSRSQDGRIGPQRRVRNRCDRNRLNERAETLDFHVPGFGDDLIEFRWIEFPRPPPKARGPSSPTWSATKAGPNSLLKIRDRSTKGDRRDGDPAASGIGARSP